jgi:hypothetical protein
MALMKAVQVNNAGGRFEPVERQVPESGLARCPSKWRLSVSLVVDHTR